MAPGDSFDITKIANGPNVRGARDMPAAKPWPPKQDGPRQSRDNIIRNYNAKDAIRAQDTRRYSQEAMQDFQRREERTIERQRQRSEYANRIQESTAGSQVSTPSHMTQEQAILRARELRAQNRDRMTMTAQESHDRTVISKENFEAERARRDVFSDRNAARTSNREVIDGRGSIDSRAFNERNELVGYSIDQRDKPEPLVETPSEQRGKWNSRSGQDFSPSVTGGIGFSGRQSDLNRLSDTISGRRDYGSSGMPLAAKLLIVLIVILLGVLIYLLFF